MSIGYVTDKTANNFTRLTQTVNKNLKTIDGYTPKNKKCFCFPYNFMVLTDNNGHNSILKYEMFNKPKQAKVTFNYYPVVSTQPVLFVAPKNYKGQSVNYDSGLQYSNFPLLPWSYDTFKNWFAMNSTQISASYAKRAIDTGVSIAMGNPTGAISAVSNTLMDLAKYNDMQNVPDVVQGSITGNTQLYSGSAGIYANCECCKAEYISKIDDYFTHYGYLVNEVRKPTLKNRKNFDYIQTKDINITGNIPQDDLQELCEIFNSGVTLWHNTNTFGDYNVNNDPV